MDSLPDEVLLACLSLLEAKELCSLACTSKRYQASALADVLWRPLYASRFRAHPPRLAAAAARAAGSWAALYSKSVGAEARHAPWRVPCKELLGAFMDSVLMAPSSSLPLDDAPAPATPGAAQAVAVLFLVDGRFGATRLPARALRRGTRTRDSHSRRALTPRGPPRRPASTRAAAL